MTPMTTAPIRFQLNPDTHPRPLSARGSLEIIGPRSSTLIRPADGLRLSREESRDDGNCGVSRMNEYVQMTGKQLYCPIFLK